MHYTATYSPDDNKLRLYAGGRLDADTYARVKAAGFRWAPKQDLFVAPMWTPDREDLLIELAGEIGDEDKSLAERADERADRFEDYSESRTKDAEHAHKAVHAIADNIPLGQPILVGHHSERHARRDAERIRSGMERAVKMWDTAQYWKSRAAGAIMHAKYKERPDVRARRIKGIEADQRKQQKAKDRAEFYIARWSDPIKGLKQSNDKPLTLREAVIYWANTDGAYYAWEHKRASGYVGPITLWEAAGGNIDDKDPESVAIATCEEICAKAIAHHKGVIVNADRWLSHYANRLEYEKAMLAEHGGTAADQTGPEAGGGCICWASPRGGWSYIQKVNRISVSVLDNWGNGGGNFRRIIPFDKLKSIMTKQQVDDARTAGTLIDTDDKTGFILSNKETIDKVKAKLEQETPPAPRAADTVPELAASIEKIKDSLAAGVKVISAPQLFPTPAALADRMVALAELEPAHRILEPSGGTGRLILAIKKALPGADLTAVEVKAHLADVIRSAYRVPTHCEDFLSCNGNLGTFDRIVMNPPFVNGEDIKHILHARTLLNEGGRLVALCANGPRQQAQLLPLATTWEDLPADTFKEEGTGVNVSLLTIDN